MSHATADRRKATALAALLRAHGLKVWFSRTHLRGADQWHDEIGRALGRCDWFLLLLTPASVESEWVRRELLFVLDDRRYRGRILPVVLQTCDPKRLSWTLPAIQRIDLRRRYEAGCREILGTWRVALRKELPERGKC